MIFWFICASAIITVLSANLRVPTSSNYASAWMENSIQYIGSKTLKELTLPGTHDSGAYWLSDVPMPDGEPNWPQEAAEIANALNMPDSWVIKNWARAHDQVLYDQLLGGIRYFDMRSGWNNETNEWVTFHYLCGSPITELLGNISQFLHEYTSEVVIVEVSHFDGYPTKANILELRTLILEILGEFIYPVNTEFNFTINDMIQSGRRAIVTMESQDSPPIWPGDCIYNTYANSPVIPTMMAFNEMTVKQYVATTWPGQLFKVSWTLTPNAQTVQNGILLTEPHTLMELADSGNPYLVSFWSNMKSFGYQVGNILIIDHYEFSDIMPVIYDMNGILTDDLIES